VTRFLKRMFEDSNHEPTEEQKEICRKLKEYLQNANVRVRLPNLKDIPKKNIKEQIRIVEAVMITMKTARHIRNKCAGVCRCKARDRKTECEAKRVTHAKGATMQKEAGRTKSSEQTSANCRNDRRAH